MTRYRLTLRFVVATAAASKGAVRLVHYARDGLVTREKPGDAGAMRRFTILAAPLLAAAWLLACEDDPSAGGGTIFLPDSGTWRKVQGIFFLPVLQNRGIDETVLPQNGTLKITNYHPNFG